MKDRAVKWAEILWVSTKLGLTSFGGPIAHLAYFHEEYVRRRKWLDERSYADLVALCQFLPGPASSQVGIGIGMMRGGLLGGLLSFIGFTWPSVLALSLFAIFMQGMDLTQAGWLHGLKLVAVAIVAHAIVGMGQKLAPDRARISIAIASAGVALLWQAAYTQVAIIGLAGLIGLWIYGRGSGTRGSVESEGGDSSVSADGRAHFRDSGSDSINASGSVNASGSINASGSANGSGAAISRRVAIASLSLFVILLFVLPLLRDSNAFVAMLDSFYRSGALVFGGGHVVLPLLENEVVGAGWVNEEQFLAGYGATQAVPGPLFTFAAFLGAVSNGAIGVVIATFAIFLPAFLLVVGSLPFWHALRGLPKIQSALAGVNAAVVGILLAALYDPIWTSTVNTAHDFTLAAVLFALLAFWKLPPWIIVIVGAAGGHVLGLL